MSNPPYFAALRQRASVRRRRALKALLEAERSRHPKLAERSRRTKPAEPEPEQVSTSSTSQEA
jgi:hypothetical protein